MSEVAESIRGQVLSLPADDRAELAFELIRSLEATSDGDIERAWDEALAARDAEIDSGKAIWRPAEEVLARLRERLS